MKLKLLFFLLPLFIFAQENEAKGVVLDAKTGAPIPYVNISIVNSKAGTSSQEDGSYTLTIYNEDLEKSVRLSSLGYHDKEITVVDLLKTVKIYLQPSIEELNEVLISKKIEDQFLEINPLRKDNIYGGFGAGTRPWNIGLYFPYRANYQQTQYLKSLTVHLNEGVFTDQRDSKFRIRLYTVGKDGLPDEDLIFQNIIINVGKDQDLVFIDLSRHSVTFPTNGLYVALEGLAIPYNAYEGTTSFVNPEGKRETRKITRYAPSFAATSALVRDHKVVFYVDGKWWNYNVNTPADQKMFIPAITLTLSN
ncbi:carboxypeptidase-like regulatory domain-containing protein [uncultured Psychroserpens sp.]|uniref:carboxypeptidase-like regulatory domain-containing protein n=1 Tax=uncultured Psychroserpens sp. TaxID=255436 RepID=UPI00263280B7|nr:carboxypeptidase-like regulatory domain-containing protein [uncultured Psychroserpens sp.]